MSASVLIYPETPANVPESVTRPSAAFKSTVSKVMGSIVLFFIVYLLLIILATGLAIASAYGGIAIIMAAPGFFTIVIGIGLLGLGIMVLFFLIKFIFAVSRFDKSGSIEIKEADHPKLFAFIRQLTNDTQTPFPKRIYLSPEVNACVFYDSGFWSMFLPVKKNLQIGLGLVNSVNLSEFKAVMAHEFGHFSQRSMKLGAFVYNVNKVIYNMLFENTSYGRSLQKWASVSDYFSIFAMVTAKIVTGIQYVLREMYGLINKNYLSLSREMEFHADAVAASVSGSDNCISALRRIELAGALYGSTIEKCNELYKEKFITGNVYHNQHYMLKQYAELYKLPLQNDLPVVSEEFLQTVNTNRVNFKDQWASHPSLEERAKHLSQLAVQADRRQESAWELFDNVEEWQATLTGKLYGSNESQDGIKILDKTGFEEKIQQDKDLFSLPDSFKGFYDRRPVTKMNIGELSFQVSTTAENGVEFENIFNAENAGLYKKISALESDLQVLKAIASKEIKTKTFDFDGSKYDAFEANRIAEKLQHDLAAMQQQMELLDKNAYRYFYRKALQVDSFEAARFKNAWTQFFTLRDESEGFLNRANEIMEAFQPLYSGAGLNIDQARQITEQIKNGEHRIKPMLERWIKDGAFDLAPTYKTEVQSFLSKSFEYFSGESFFNEELSTLHMILNEGWRHINDFQFRKLKEILEMQAALN